jgi:hypothetical protein
MKTITALFALFCCTATAAPQHQVVPTTLIPVGPAEVIERGVNHKVWQQTFTETSPRGKVVQKKRSYTELATGSCYQQNGVWLDADPEVVIAPDGTGFTKKAAHSAHFLSDISSDQSISSTVGGKQLNSHVLGLCYYDWKNQREAQIAGIKSSIGTVTDKSHVLYGDAFDNISADVRYTFKKSGLAQDVIFREQLPSPADFQMDPATTRVEVWTEFVHAPQAALRHQRQHANGQQHPEIIDFDGVYLRQGAAFAIQNQNDKIPVNKDWQKINGRTFFIESLDYQALLPHTANLPAKQHAAVQKAADPIANASRRVPSRFVAKVDSSSKLRIASNTKTEPAGFVLDYEEISSTSASDYTFYGDTTYYITDEFDVGSLTIEGNSVIKYGPYGQVVPGSVTCTTAAYRPTIFTSKDDNSVGEPISGSTGTPTLTGSFGLFVLPGANLHDLRFTYLTYPCVLDDGILDNVQMAHCQIPIWVWSDGSVSVRNSLVTDFLTLIYSLYSTSVTNTLQNVTV